MQRAVTVNGPLASGVIDAEFGAMTTWFRMILLLAVDHAQLPKHGEMPSSMPRWSRCTAIVAPIPGGTTSGCGPL
ncbi:hypothetical protein D3C71_2163490 [compost metagenome]